MGGWTGKRLTREGYFGLTTIATSSIVLGLTEAGMATGVISSGVNVDGTLATMVAVTTGSSTSEINNLQENIRELATKLNSQRTVLEAVVARLKSASVIE